MLWRFVFATMNKNDVLMDHITVTGNTLWNLTVIINH